MGAATSKAWREGSTTCTGSASPDRDSPYRDRYVWADKKPANADEGMVFPGVEKSTWTFVISGAYGFEHVNVAAQRRDPDSLLNWTERALRMRQEIPEVSWGDFKVLPQPQPSVLVMRYEWRNNTVLFVHNLLADPQEIELIASAIGDGGEQLTNLLSEDHSAAGANGRHCILLEPYGYRWFRVGGLDYLLRRSDA